MRLPAASKARPEIIGCGRWTALFTPVPGGNRQIVNYRGDLDAVTRIDGGRLVSNQGYLYDLISPLERISAFGRVTFDISDDFEWFGQAMFSSFEGSNEVSPQTIGTAGTSATIPVTNPSLRPTCGNSCSRGLIRPPRFPSPMASSSLATR